jgi:hypothetical protein
MEGKLEIFLFDDNINMTEKKSMDIKEKFMYRGEPESYHVYIPKTEYVIFREIRGGTNDKQATTFLEQDPASIIGQYAERIDLRCRNFSCQNPCSLLEKKVD